MNDRPRSLEDRLRSEWAESLQTAPPPGLLDRVRRSARATPQRSRRPAAAFALVGLAAALLLVAVVAFAWQAPQHVATSPTPGASAVPSPGPASPTPSASPPSPSPVALVAGTVAEAVESFPFVDPLPVEVGQRVFLVEGPVVHDGTPAYLLQHWGDFEHGGLRPDSDFAWMDAEEAGRLLRPVTVECPEAAPSLREVAALQIFERLVCFGDRSLTFGPVVTDDYHVGAKTSSRWISERGPAGFSTALPLYPEETALAIPEGTWVTVTGHFDDPSSAECGGASEVAWCRERFMVTSIVPAEAPDFELKGTWRRTRTPPIGGRTGHVVVWTGTEMLVWGGVEAPLEGDPFVPRNGAAYDPVANTWRKIPSAPIAGRESPIAAWTGGEMLVWGGRDVTRDLSDGAAYDPAADRWRVLPPAPLSPRQNADAEGGDLAVGGWVGDRLIVAMADGTAAYDPASDRWTELDPAPIRPGWRIAAVAAGRLVVIAFGDGATGDVEGAVLDPATGAWTRVDVPLTPLDAGATIAAAGDVVLLPVYGKQLDPTTGTWSDVAACRADEGAVWTGRYLLGIGNAYDAEADTCLDLPPSPSRAAPFEDTTSREFPVAVWTGGLYITWSGATTADTDRVPNDGAVFRPAADLDPRD